MTLTIEYGEGGDWKEEVRGKELINNTVLCCTASM
jgi:hypothetical protein